MLDNEIKKIAKERERELYKETLSREKKDNFKN